MTSNRWLIVLSATVLSLLVTTGSLAQSITGSLAGSVQDTQHAAVPNAKVTATQLEKKITLTTNADSEGKFVFTDLQPGTYSIKVEATGFRPLQRDEVPLHADDRISVGDLELQIGNVTETVTVTEQQPLMQTESGERSDTLISKQIENIQVNGRNAIDLVKLVPGVVSTASFQQASNAGLSSIFVNGNRGTMNQVTINGITNVDTGGNGSFNATVSIDATQEFKILTSSYQAEYGRSAGGQIAVITKSGGEQFHGSAYYYHRHEGFNANSWLNNRNNLPRALYRYNDPGYTIGGPVIIPHLLPRGQDKLFFFFGQEFQKQLVPVAAKNITVPTALERTGDFSQSVDQNGAKITIRDPNTQVAITGNLILPRNLYAPGVALLKIFPLPNVTGVKGYNYTSQVSGQLPRREDVLRVDYNATPNLRFFAHYINNLQRNDTPYGGSIFGLNFPLVTILHPTTSNSTAFGFTWTLNPRTTNQFLIGTSHNAIHYAPADSSLTRATSGINLPLLFPNAVQSDLIPNAAFAGSHLSNSPNFGTSNGPYDNHNTVLDIADNLSKVVGRHFLKTGIFLEYSIKDQITGAGFNGTYNFGDTTSNPYDTGYGYSNALLGVYQTFTQASTFANGKYRYWDFEGFVQDTWKVTNHLTLDYGLRLASYQPQYDSALQTSTFDPSAWDPTKAPRLYQPCKVGTVRSACDSISGQTLRAFAIGLEVPGTGDVLNGVVKQSDSNKYLTQYRAPQWAPRFGFAYSPGNTGSTVIRGAAGLYYDRVQGNRTFSLIANPPTTLQPTLTYGFAQDIASGTALVSPPSLSATDKTGKVPNVMNYSLGIQQRIPFGIVADAAYVGGAARHLQVNRNLNYVPFGAAYLTANQDPSLAVSALAGGSALPLNFLRPYRGYGDITLFESSAASNYNSLQLALQRRFSERVFFGVSYTYSKSLSTTSTDTQAIRPDSHAYNDLANYGPTTFDRRHVFSANYVLSGPSFNRHSLLVRSAAGGWQLSGVTQAYTGSPFTPAFTLSGASSVNITGSYTENGKLRVLCNPYTGRGGGYGRLNPACFGTPQPGSLGIESGSNYLNNPGLINFDMALEKQFSVHERVHVQFRIDAFNVFNHPNFTGLNTTLAFTGYPNSTVTNPSYDASGALTNVNGFGSVSTVGDPRILQTLVRVRF